MRSLRYLLLLIFLHLQNFAHLEPVTEKNPCTGSNELWDPKRPNIFVDRNNLLGKTDASSKPHNHVEFSYGTGPTGPAHWPKIFKQCRGKHQSPIDINLSSLKTLHMPKLTWGDVYSQIPEVITVSNNGHTVIVKPKFGTGQQATIRGGPLNAIYVLDHVHFHWGSTDHKGSEHTINGKSFPMEMHAVHIKEHLTMEQAVKLSDGIAVVAYIFEIEDKCHIPIRYIQEVFEIIEMDVGAPQPLQNMFPIGELAEPFCSGYVTYQGSMTTPPCAESVTWIASPYTVGMSKNQLRRFRSLYDSSKGLVNNFRPTQPLNGRLVHFAT